MRKCGKLGANKVKRGAIKIIHGCDHAAHQKSQHPIARDGKVGVSRLPEEDHHRCAEGDLVFEKV